MREFVYMRLKRENKDLTPADLDSDEEREAIKFQKTVEKAEKNAAQKNKDILKL
jgi:hypothetical protein